jgi:hypothetical protein
MLGAVIERGAARVYTGCGKTLQAVILRSPPFLLADDEGPPQLPDFKTAEILRSYESGCAEGALECGGLTPPYHLAL